MTVPTKMPFTDTLTALYNSTTPMSVSEIARTVHTASEDVSRMLTQLLSQSEGYSPVRRLKNDSYTLTTWARAQMAAGKQPADPRSNAPLLLETLPSERHTKVTAVFIEDLRSLPDGIQTKTSLIELLHILADKNYALIGDTEPRAVMPQLDAALGHLDREGPYLLWGEVGQEPELLWTRKETSDGRADFGSRWARVPLIERIQLIEKFKGASVSNDVFPGTLNKVEILSLSPDAASQLLLSTSSGTYRVHIGELGHTITADLVNRLANERQVGEKYIILAQGRIAEKAKEEADHYDINIIPMDRTSDLFQLFIGLEDMV